LLVESIAISEFKATCLSVLGRVQRTGQPVLITKHGRPVAQVVPPPPPAPPEGSAFGCMQARMKETGDLIAPLPEEEWEALRS